VVAVVVAVVVVVVALQQLIAVVLISENRSIVAKEIDLTTTGPNEDESDNKIQAKRIWQEFQN
jgi:hypothetical protein